MRGACNGHSRFLVGFQARRDIPQATLGLVMDVPLRILAKGGRVDVIDGVIDMVPGAADALSGRATIEPDARGGTFIVYGRGESGRTGRRYTGAWDCGSP